MAGETEFNPNRVALGCERVGAWISGSLSYADSFLSCGSVKLGELFLRGFKGRYAEKWVTRVPFLGGGPHVFNNKC